MGDKRRGNPPIFPSTKVKKNQNGYCYTNPLENQYHLGRYHQHPQNKHQHLLPIENQNVHNSYKFDNIPTNLTENQQPQKNALQNQNLDLKSMSNPDLINLSDNHSAHSTPLQENSHQEPNQTEKKQRQLLKNHHENPHNPKSKSRNNSGDPSSLSNKPDKGQQQLPSYPEKDFKDNPSINIQEAVQAAEINKNQNQKHQEQFQKFNDNRQIKINEWCEDLQKRIGNQNLVIGQKRFDLEMNLQLSDDQKYQIRLFLFKKQSVVNEVESIMEQQKTIFILQSNQWFEQDRSQYPSKLDTIFSSFQEGMKTLLEQFIEEIKKIEIQEENRIQWYNDKTNEKKLSLQNLNNCLKESFEKCQTKEKEIFQILDSLEAEIKSYENSTNNQTNF